MSHHAESLCVELGLTFVGPIGSGAFKNVYRVEKDGELDLVLKIAKEPGATARDFRETESLQRCDHPKVTVGFCSSDVILWKAAGASHCSTGKFFNLRRFTPSRWDPAAGGGGQLPYWIEEGLMAYLRESDILRVRQAGLASEVSESLPHSSEILVKIEEGTAWVAESWRHYLEWFVSIEARIELGITEPRAILALAERNSLRLDDLGILMEEPRNNFSWLRPWRRVLSEA